MGRRTLGAIVLCAATTLGGARGETETSYALHWRAGGDSNPLEVSGDGPGAAFSELALEGGLTHWIGSGATAAWFLDGDATVRAHERSTADADFERGSARIGLAYSPALAGRRLLVSLGGRVSAYQGTFTDPATGEVYRASVAPATDPPSSVAIPERLDQASRGVFVKVRFKQNKRLTYSLASSVDEVHFPEGYGDSTDLDPLDYRTVTLSPRLAWQLGELAVLDLGASWADLDYERRPALDRGGNPVPGTSRRYHYVQYFAGLRVRPAKPWSLSLDLSGGGREDTYAGYYDDASRAGSLTVEREVGERGRFSVAGSVRELDYDHATVSGDPTDPPQTSDEQRYQARYSLALGERLSWHVEAGAERVDNQDPIFAYDRDFVFTGVDYGRRQTH